MKSFFSRRDFIKLPAYLLGVLGLGGVIRFLSYQANADSPTEFNLGDSANYPIGSKTIRRDIPAVIENRDGRFIAYSLTCTHLGCTADADGDGFACACHGSRFNQNGSVRMGPAKEPLHRLRIEVTNDHILMLYTR